MTIRAKRKDRQLTVHHNHLKYPEKLERARRIERPTLTLARLCSTPELRPHSKFEGRGYRLSSGRFQAVLAKAESGPSVRHQAAENRPDRLLPRKQFPLHRREIHRPARPGQK